MRFWGSSKLDEIGWYWMHIQAWIWWQGILLQSQFSLFLCVLKPEAYAQKLDRSKTPTQLHIMNWHPDPSITSNHGIGGLPRPEPFLQSSCESFPCRVQNDIYGLPCTQVWAQWQKHLCWSLMVTSSDYRSTDDHWWWLMAFDWSGCCATFHNFPLVLNQCWSETVPGLLF